MRASPVLATHIPQRASEAAWPVFPLHRQGGALLWGSFPALKPLSRKFYGTPWWLKMERHPALSGLGDFGIFRRYLEAARSPGEDPAVSEQLSLMDAQAWSGSPIRPQSHKWVSACHQLQRVTGP